jgi:hypothetical protein
MIPEELDSRFAGVLRGSADRVGPPHVQSDRPRDSGGAEFRARATTVAHQRNPDGRGTPDALR